MMQIQPTDNFPAALLLWATEFTLGGLVASHIALWMAFMRYKLHVSEEYVNKKENLKVERSIDDIQQTLKDILAIVHELKGRAAGAQQ